MEKCIKIRSKTSKMPIDDKNKNRMDRRAYTRLKQEESVFQKSIEHFLTNTKISPVIDQNIQKEFNIMNSERHNVQKQLMMVIADVFEELKAAKLVMNDLQRKEQVVNIDSYKAKLQNIWTKIENFKGIQRSLETLTDEQKILESELSEYSNILQKCENKNDTSHSLTSLSKIDCSVKRENQDYDKIDNFCSLIARTGHTNGWTQEDHSFFIRLRKKHSSIPSLVAAIRTKCPDLTPECVVNHEAWYKTYLTLQEKQRTAVKEWRNQKESERITKIVSNRRILERGIEGKEGKNEQNKKQQLKKKNTQQNLTEPSEISNSKHCTFSTDSRHPQRPRVSTFMKPTKGWEAKIKPRENKL